MLWLVMSGEVRGTPAQREFVRKVDRVFLNYRDPSTPKSYLRMYAKHHPAEAQQAFWYNEV